MAGDIFLNFEGGDVEIKGESTDESHAEWVDVESFSLGFNQAGTFGTGGGGGAGKVQGSDLSISKKVDAATPAILKAITTGAHIDTVTLEVRKAGGEQIVYYKVVLSHALISSTNTGGGGDMLSEQLSLNYAKIAVTYFPQTEAGKQGAAKETEWDFSKNK
ncbi:MAG: type VI secretion system tube protein Hcp [Pseudaminobacter sp.]|nr:type VI secretion system tube protein Hcp [Pseudaminobacter sp.]